MKRRRIIPYQPHLVEKARQLRNNSTITERIVWKKIRHQQLGIDFHRQKPIDRFIVDFYAPDIGLVIELDGVSHEGKLKYDRQRQQRLESFGLKVLRFTDRRVRIRLRGVIDTIGYWVKVLKEENGVD